MCSIRGGGEYGEEWHQAGARLKKQNCFDDMASCAKFLIDSGATTPKQLSIMGGSNGGLLVLACALQQPQLYGAVISQVPVTDMLRFHKFTIGSAWRGEYGYVEDSKDDFENVMKYSPLHKATSFEGQLPSILITTADHDDRVVPLHSFKMIATLQATATRNGGNTAPLLARIDVKAGHGAGKPTSKVLEEYADIFSFLYHETALKYESN
jgi:prolyl oligopeptidase